MKTLEQIEQELLRTVANLSEVPTGAYNFRVNGESIGRQSSGNINIVPQKSRSGIEIYVSPNTQDEVVHIPVIISQSGLAEVVYNDFYIGNGADITIVAASIIAVPKTPFMTASTLSMSAKTLRYVISKNITALAPERVKF